MAILIDGHNLIAQIADLDLSDPDDEAKLVQRLRVYRNVANQPITVFFDHGPTYTPPHNLSGGGVEAVFSSVDSPADGLIIARIRNETNPRQIVVVSSDREIQRIAQSYGAKVLTAREFAAQMVRNHAPQHKRRKRVRREPRLSAREVDEWLAIFEERAEE